jgi:hypothetical protein
MKRTHVLVSRGVGVLVACLLGVACSREERAPAAPPPAPPAPVQAPAAAVPAPFLVTAVQLGSALGPEKRVVAARTAFAPGDTIYASVLTDGNSAGVTLAARWTYEDGQVVNESQQTIASAGPATTEFHIAKPSGWPAGRYKVEVIADGRVAAAREFVVR